VTALSRRSFLLGTSAVVVAAAVPSVALPARRFVGAYHGVPIYEQLFVVLPPYLARHQAELAAAMPCVKVVIQQPFPSELRLALS
jgi:hypothetical protein